MYDVYRISFLRCIIETMYRRYDVSYVDEIADKFYVGNRFYINANVVSSCCYIVSPTVTSHSSHLWRHSYVDSDWSICESTWSQANQRLSSLRWRHKIAALSRFVVSTTNSRESLLGTTVPFQFGYSFYAYTCILYTVQYVHCITFPCNTQYLYCPEVHPVSRLPASGDL